jgi:hypothetical protein
MKEFFTIILIFIVSIGLIGGLGFILEKISCQNKYEEFPNRYGIWQGCQIKPDDKWIPAESYYFKEE